MSTSLHNMSNYNPDIVPNANSLCFGIVVSDYNPDITYSLLDGCYETLVQHGALSQNIFVWHVPGAYELPLGAKLLYQTVHPDALICLGCVITGETKHDEYINRAVSDALMRLGLKYNTPFVFGVLTPQNISQAQDRAGGKHGNKGVEAAIAAIRMAALKHTQLQIEHQHLEDILRGLEHKQANDKTHDA